MIARFLRSLCVFIVLATTHSADAACRQALALGLDVSGSVDKSEYAMQLNGLAAALQSPSISNALLKNVAAPVMLAVFEWSGPDSQRLLIPWTPIINANSVDAVTTSLRRAERTRMEVATGLGPALDYGASLLMQMPACWRLTLDISGDGKANSGPLPRDAQLPARITVNGLVIGPGNNRPSGDSWTETSALVAYFDAWVIRGADAFVEVANGYEDFEAAMTRKLFRELQGLPVASLPRH